MLAPGLAGPDGRPLERDMDCGDSIHKLQQSSNGAFSGQFRRARDGPGSRLFSNKSVCFADDARIRNKYAQNNLHKPLFVGVAFHGFGTRALVAQPTATSPTATWHLCK